VIFKLKEISLNLVVQASASQGGGVALVEALKSTTTVDQLAVSPLCCGSNPYPRGSLTYRPCSL